MKQKFLFLIPILILIGLTAAFSAQAMIVCPTADPYGVGCPSEPSQQYYCNSACRSMDVAYCPTNELTPVAPCTGLDGCGVCNTCQTNYLLCTGSAYPTRSCTYNDPALHCASLTNSNCTAGQCASCVPGYTRCVSNNTCIATLSCQPWETFDACTNTCVGATPILKLAFDSVNVSNQIIQSASPVLAIPSSGYVGIGTTAPGAKLEVVPTSGYSILAGELKIGNVALPTADADAATKGYIDSTIASATSSITLWGGTIGGNIWNLNSGYNVGIGTTSPGRKLHLLATSGSVGQRIEVSEAASEKYAFTEYYAYDGTSSTSIGEIGVASSGSSDPYAKKLYLTGYKDGITFLIGTSEKMRIDSSGNIGIGTIAPLGLLHSVKLAGSNNFYSDTYSTTSAERSQILFRKSHQATLGNTATVTAEDLGGIVWQGNSGSAFTNAAQIKSVQNGTAGTYTPADITFWTSDGTNALAERMRILADGSVGIGTTAPGAKLDVAGSFLNSLAVTHSALGGGGSLLVMTDNSGTLYATTTSGTLSLPTGTSGQTLRHDGTIWVADSNLFNTGTNVGIGTTNPLSLLTVKKDQDAETVIKVDNTMGSGINSTARFWAASDVASVYMISHGTGRTGTRQGVTLANYSEIVTSLGNGLLIGTNAAVPVLIGTNSTNAIYIDSSQRVGIGTTAPSEKLEIESDTLARLRLQNTGDANALLYLDANRSATDSHVGRIFGAWNGTNVASIDFTAGDDTINKNDGYIKFQVGQSGTLSEAMRIEQNGFVGIGITVPASKFHLVNDNIAPMSYWDNYTNTSNNLLIFRSGRGNKTTPTAATTDLVLGGFTGQGYYTDGTPGFSGNDGIVGIYAAENFTSTAQGTYIVLGTTSIGSTTRTERMRILADGSVGIGTTAPGAKLDVSGSFLNSLATTHSALGGGGNLAVMTDNSGLLYTAAGKTLASFVGSTTAGPYNGNRGGYTNANTLCSGVVSGSHVCTTEEILNTINSGLGGNIPASTILWISNGPPAYTANANDCMGWTSGAYSDFGAVWVKSTSGDGYGSLTHCDEASQFACCK